MQTHLRSAIGVLKPYERHLSAIAMVGGFAFDNWAFGPLDHRVTHVVFISYLLMAGLAIVVLHYLEARPEETNPSHHVRNLIALSTQFALGALLSGFCVFYLRSAALTASWPYLLVLAVIFIGNEIYREHLSRLILSTLLFFFALLSYTILLVPVVMARTGTEPFILAGLSAVILFALFLQILSSINEDRLRPARLRIVGGVLATYFLVSGSYFVGILPPLPLALVDAGIFHAARKVGTVYEVRGEPVTWRQWFGWPPAVHLTAGERLFFYSAVFVPIRMSVPIVHRWQWYNPQTGRWEGQGDVRYTVTGGRDAGFRGYSVKSQPKPGEWRVEVATGDGRPMGRVGFVVERVAAPASLETKILN